MIDSDGNTALMFAVKSGKKEAVEYLLKQKATVDHVNNLGLTPLHLAVRKNSQDMVRVLLEYGADINITELLLAFGIDEISVSSSAILKVRKKIRETDTRKVNIRKWL